jgi:hypothetical protein
MDIHEFCRQIAPAVHLPPHRLEACDRLVDELGLDELSWAGLIAAVESLNPYFSLPDQVEPTDVTLDDLYHFYRTMDAGHLAPAGGAS